MTKTPTETTETTDNIVLLGDTPPVDDDLKSAKPKSAARKPAAKETKMTKKTAKKVAAKSKAEKKPKAEKKTQRLKGPGHKLQTQVTQEQFKYAEKAAKEDGVRPADVTRDAWLSYIDRRFGTTYVKDAKAAAKDAAKAAA